VPRLEEAIAEALTADIFVVIGTSLNVYPAASLVQFVMPGVPIYLIDPKEVNVPTAMPVTVIKATATEGMKLLMQELR
jgi:NAD-dependent deacetylase